jgi:hypothetical protein
MFTKPFGMSLSPVLRNASQQTTATCGRCSSGAARLASAPPLVPYIFVLRIHHPASGVHIAVAANHSFLLGTDRFDASLHAPLRRRRSYLPPPFPPPSPSHAGTSRPSNACATTATGSSTPTDASLPTLNLNSLWSKPTFYLVRTQRAEWTNARSCRPPASPSAAARGCCITTSASCELSASASLPMLWHACTSLALAAAASSLPP